MDEEEGDQEEKETVNGERDGCPQMEDDVTIFFLIDAGEKGRKAVH